MDCVVLFTVILSMCLYSVFGTVNSNANIFTSNELRMSRNSNIRNLPVLLLLLLLNIIIFVL